MKLSEAMMLASTMGESPDNSSYDRCLIGISCHALGASNHLMESHKRWPWLETFIVVPRCSPIYSGWEHKACVFITGLCAEVERGRLSVNRAAELVAMVEPQDIENEQTDGGQVTHPTELSRSDEVQNIGV